jgi:hypothetical protein
LNELFCEQYEELTKLNIKGCFQLTQLDYNGENVDVSGCPNVEVGVSWETWERNRDIRYSF